MINEVTIIGDGAMATVCAILLANKGLGVRMWGAFPEHIEQLHEFRENKRFLPGYRIPESVSLTGEAKRAMADVDLIVSAVPCQYIRSVWQRIKPAVPADVPICSVAKGIENGTLLRPTQVITDVVGEHPMASLSGPSIAPELARRLPATVVAASSDAELAHEVQETFSTDWFRVYTNPDLLGVELAGATKNVIALAAGIVDGLKAGDNAKAALLSRGLVEITRLGLALGARRETFFGLAGLGDLVTTCISPVGRNRSAGELFGKGKKLKEVLQSTESVIEGIPTTQSVIQLARKSQVEMPITRAVYSVLFEDKDVIEAITELMTRQLKEEM
jgi:glycerol-3-phosphate dehydrogenase (NAD(P)+)